MIPATVRVLHGVHCAPADLRPAVPLHRYLWKAAPALSIGFSIRPPPATMPTMHRAADGTVFRAPEGIRIRVFFPSSEWPTMIQDAPLVFAMVLRSPVFASTLETTVPSGQDFS